MILKGEGLWWKFAKGWEMPRVGRESSWSTMKGVECKCTCGENIEWRRWGEVRWWCSTVWCGIAWCVVVWFGVV